MYRVSIKHLDQWHKKKNRKPLIINGARQIGKSWLVRYFGENTYSKNFVELNFEKKPQLCKIFDRDLDIQRILIEIEISENVTIDTKTLLFLDEIQQCPKAIMALRYFYEDHPKQAVIAAGSLLEFQLKDMPFPVGRVEILHLFPMNFEEFLIATKNDKLLPYVQLKKKASEVIESKIYHELLNYYWVGGMPACVKEFVETKNYKTVRKIQEDLLYTFQQDFSKYSPQVNKDCLLDILNSVSNNIGGQIIYSKLSERSSMPTIKKGVLVLATAKIFTLVNNVSADSLPFTISNKQFKALFIDIGLLLCVSKVNFESIFLNSDLNTNFTGAWAEQFVGQQLLANHFQPLHYWARTKANSSAEVDFLIEKEGKIIPIEVKSGKSGKLRSLHILLSEHPNIKEALIYSKAQDGREGKLRFLPIYSAGIL